MINLYDMESYGLMTYVFIYKIIDAILYNYWLFSMSSLMWTNSIIYSILDLSYRSSCVHYLPQLTVAVED